MKEKLIAVEILMTVLLRGSDIGTQNIGVNDVQIQETQLLEMMEACAGHEMEDYVYVDMDHNGTEELIGVYLDEKNHCQAWYCSDDGQICTLVYQGKSDVDECIIEILDVEEETHIALNSACLFGPWKYYTVLALKNQEIICLLVDQNGYVRMTEEGDIALTIEDYDGIYDPDYGMTTHTWKDTYLFYDGSTYQEYEAAEMTEKAFLSCQNAQAVKDEIDRAWDQPDVLSLEYAYYLRDNGILHIQCDVQYASGEIQYGYYTVRYEDDVLDKEFGEYNPGQMRTRLFYSGNTTDIQVKKQTVSTVIGDVTILEKSLYTTTQVEGSDLIRTWDLRYPFFDGNAIVVLDQINEQIYALVQEKQMLDSEWDFSTEMTYEVTYIDERFVSILFNGNVSGSGYSEGCWGMNFDLETGKLLSLEDFYEWEELETSLIEAMEQDRLSVQILKGYKLLEGEEKKEYLQKYFMELLPKEAYIRQDDTGFFIKDGYLYFITAPYPSCKQHTYVRWETEDFRDKLVSNP